VAVWKWDVEEDTCGICRMPFDGPCTDCKLPGDDCPIRTAARCATTNRPGALTPPPPLLLLLRVACAVLGQCTHCFHMHCILRWLQSHEQCPMCRRPWRES